MIQNGSQRLTDANLDTMNTRRNVSLSSDCASWGEYELIRQFVNAEKENERSKTKSAKMFSIGQWDVSVLTFNQYVDSNLTHVTKIRKGWRKFFVDPAIKKSLIKNIGVAAPRFGEYIGYVDRYESKKQDFKGFCNEIKQRFRMFQDIMTENREPGKLDNKSRTDSMETNPWQSWIEKDDDENKQTKSNWSICSQTKATHSTPKWTQEISKRENTEQNPKE